MSTKVVCESYIVQERSRESCKLRAAESGIGLYYEYAKKD